LAVDAALAEEWATVEGHLLELVWTVASGTRQTNLEDVQNAVMKTRRRIQTAGQTLDSSAQDTHKRTCETRNAISKIIRAFLALCT
jgi:hypothetical protein